MSLLAANNLLNAILLKDLLLNDVIKWLTQSDTSDILENDDLSHFKCSRGDFALFFLNYLREQTHRILNSSSDQTTSIKVKPQNAIIPGQHRLPVKSNLNAKDEQVGYVHSRSDQESKLPDSQDFPCLSGDVRKAMRQQCNDILANCSGSEKKSVPIVSSSTNRNLDNTRLLNCTSRSVEVSSSTSQFLVPEIESPVKNLTANAFTGDNTFGSSRNFHRRNVNSKVNNETSFSPSGSGLNLGDFITRDNRRGGLSQRRRRTNDSVDWKMEGGKAQPRRINPTRLTVAEQETGVGSPDIRSSFGSVTRTDEPSAPFKDTTTFQASQPDFGQERDLLRLERLKHQANSIATSKTLPVKTLESVKPDLNLVQDKESLNILACLYSCLIDANLVLNLSSELCFLINLIIVNDYSQISNSSDKINNLHEDFKLLNLTHLLDSVHNCIYFSTLVLNLQRDLFSLFDRSSLKLLAENIRVLSFNSMLWEYLTELYTTHTFNKPAVYFQKEAATNNVTFMYETDNKQSFPTEAAFHNFKKQRDGFYDVLQVWEKNHLSPSFSFATALGAKIRSLVNIHNEPANFIHFARLFRCQLLSTCAGQALDEADGLDDDTLKCLKEINPEKYALLRDRLVRPQESGVSTRPEFPGLQEFFKEFIVVANSVAFYSHLVDNLATELLTLNDTNFTSSQLDERATSVDQATRASFVGCVTSLRLLAKFLGFLVFLPYRSTAVLTQDVAISHAQVRNKVLAPVDILNCIEKAVIGRQLVLTIPWVVKYLSMMDVVSISLSYYTTVLQTLFHIYRSMAKPISETNRLSPSTVSLIKLSLGWLFESPNFPQGLYFSWCSNQNFTSQNKLLAESSELPVPLDRMELVDWQALQSLCPHLARLKVVDTSNTARHITPAALQPLASAGDQLQLQLEESFFHGQSSSTRRTVVFVAERVASSCVKHVTTLVAEQKKLAIAQLRAADGRTSVAELAASSATETLAKCLTEVDKHCVSRTKAALPALLPLDTLDPVLQVCLQIATRQSKAKAYAWAKVNITQGVFVKEFETEVDRLQRHSTPAATCVKTSHVVLDGARGVVHIETATPPPATITALRDCVFRVQSKEGVVTEQDLVEVLGMVEGTISHREDLIPTAEVVMHTLLVDLALALVVHRPSLVAPVVDTLVCLLSTKELGGAICLLSVRTVLMLGVAGQPGSLAAMGVLLRNMLQARLVTVKQVNSQCSLTLKKVSLPSLEACVAGAIRDYNHAVPRDALTS